MVALELGPTYPQGVRSYIAPHTSTCSDLAICVSLPEGFNLHPPPIAFVDWIDWLIGGPSAPQTSLAAHLEQWELELAAPTIERLWAIRHQALASASIFAPMIVWFRDSSDDPEVPSGCRAAARTAWMEASAMYTELRDLAGWTAAAVNHLRRTGLDRG